MKRMQETNGRKEGKNGKRMWEGRTGERGGCLGEHIALPGPHTLAHYCAPHSNIPYLTTAHCIATYPNSLPLIAYHHTVAHYRSLHSNIPKLTTSHCIATYPNSLPLIPYHHTLPHYRSYHTTIP
eukprot:718238-Rhodomonas_salina.1